VSGVGGRIGRRTDRGALHVIAPPLLALVVSSPAIVSGLTGTADPLQVVTVVAVSLAAMWLLLAALAHLGRRAPQRAVVPVRNRNADHAAGAARSGPVPLARIDPVRAPASEAIPGDPPPDPTTEGPLA